MVMSSELHVKFNQPLVDKIVKNRKETYYGVSIEMFENELFTKKKVESMVEVEGARPMFFEVAINSTHEFDLKLRLSKCFGRPQNNVDTKEQYVFIENDCPRDRTVIFYPSPVTDRVRFSVQPFAFADTPDNVVINCYVKACPKADIECRQGCDESEHPNQMLH